jgi:AP-3 complex subunit beta
MAAAKVIYYAGTQAYLQRILHPLLKLLHKSREVERIVLVYLLRIVPRAPVRRVVLPLLTPLKDIDHFEQELFSPYYYHFLLRADDPREVKRDKIRLLLKILNSDNYGAILREFIV